MKKYKNTSANYFNNFYGILCRKLFKNSKEFEII